VAIRVPLLFPVTAVIHRLDLATTRAVDPPGAPTAGYDDILREPVGYDQAGVRTSPRRELAAVRVPCQVEMRTYEELRMIFTGNDPVGTTVLVLHRKDLSRLSLLSSTTGNCLLKAEDRISRLEQRGRVILTPQKPLFIYAVLPASWGMGPDGYDLHIVYTTERTAYPLAA